MSLIEVPYIFIHITFTFMVENRWVKANMMWYVKAFCLYLEIE